LLGFSVSATEEKDAIVQALQRAIRPIRNMAELAYSGKGKYSVFGFENMTILSDSDLYRMGKRVARVATKLRADLVPQGLTDEFITAVNKLCNDLDLAIDHMEEHVENRDMETQNRIMKGNALYAEMIRLASVGKSLYEDSDEARYNDYVIIGANPTPSTPAAGAEAAVVP
jgi:hypothetical protein